MYKTIPCKCECGRVTGSRTVLATDPAEFAAVKCKTCATRSFVKSLNFPDMRPLAERGEA